MVNNSIIHLSYTKEGCANLNDIHDIHTLYNISSYDLYFAPEKREGWMNLHKESSVIYRGSDIFSSEEEAKKFAHENTITTIKIEWEE